MCCLNYLFMNIFSTITEDVVLGYAFGRHQAVSGFDPLIGVA